MVHEFHASFAHIFEISAQRQILDEIISLRDKQQSPPATTFLSVCTQNPAHRETRLCTYIYIHVYQYTQSTARAAVPQDFPLQHPRAARPPPTTITSYVRENAASSLSPSLFCAESRGREKTM